MREFCKVDAEKTEQAIQHMDEVLNPTNTVLSTIAGSSKNNSQQSSRMPSKDNNVTIGQSLDCENPLQQHLLITSNQSESALREATEDINNIAEDDDDSDVESDDEE